MPPRLKAFTRSADLTKALMGAEAALGESGLKHRLAERGVFGPRQHQRRPAILRTTCIWLAVALGLGAIANGLFMLAAPDAWYVAVPGVTTTGPFNQHFIRDIGLIFLLLGGALLTGAAKPRLRSLLWTGTAIWLSGHALFHVWEVLAGICAPSALVRDFGAVSLPAILTWLLAWWALDEDRKSSAPGLHPRRA